MLTETRQYYTLYNSLEDQKAYTEKEVCHIMRDIVIIVLLGRYSEFYS